MATLGDLVRSSTEAERKRDFLPIIIGTAKREIKTSNSNNKTRLNLFILGKPKVCGFCFYMQQKSVKYLLFLVLIFFVSACGGVKKTLRKADTAYENGEYYEAGELYKKAYSRISYKDRELRGTTAFKQAECYRLTSNARAEQIYKNAIRNKYPDSIAFFRLGQIQQKNGKYNEALKSYTTYLEYDPESPQGKFGLKSLELADSLRKNPSRFIIKKEKHFNVGRSSSFSPAFVGEEGNVLIFTSNRKYDKKEKNQKRNSVSGQPNNSLFQVRKNSQGNWEKPEVLEGEVTSKNDEGIASFTSNGQTMYYTRSMTEESKGEGTLIVTSRRSEGSWSDPSAITLYNDSSISVAHPAISPDGSTLYFVSNAPNGEGGKDIYRTKLENGKPGYIENLGTAINTPGDEMFPSFHPDGTLYFSSNGHPGMGGLDIFKAEEITLPDSTKTWKVENIGSPINSNGDDFGITFSGNPESGQKDVGFFSSNRNETRGYDAIWSFVLPELEYFLEGKILARNGNPIPTGRINIVGNDGETAKIFAKGDGSYRFKLKKGVNYQLQASADEYLNERDSISTHVVNERESQTFIRNFSLIPTFSSVKLDNIYYDFDKATLRPESKEGLDALIGMMNENPHITIEMSAHTDYKGNNEYNRILSYERAQSVIDYLIEAGIDGARLSAVGYGEVKPFVIDTKHNQLFGFLSIGTELTEEYILSLPEEEQEVANQINRRTEFKIVSTTYNIQ